MNMSRHLANSLSALTLILVVSTAHAQGAAVVPAAPATSPAPLSASLTGDAKSDYDTARSLFEVSDFGGALLKFKHALEISNDPRLLWNMAACEKELHHYGSAVTLVERFLREGTNISAESRANATETLTALRGLYSSAKLTGLPDGAEVYVDDQLVGQSPLPAPLKLDLGSHKVRIEHPDFEVFEKSLEGITGGSEIEIAVALKPLTAGHLTIIASPGDTIALDSKVVGSERWDSSIAPGLHNLRVTAVGKLPYEVDVELAPRGTRSIQVSLVAESKRMVWPWVVGGAFVVASAVVGGYFLFKPKDEPGPYTPGGLGTVILPTGVRFR